MGLSKSKIEPEENAQMQERMWLLLMPDKAERRLRIVHDLYRCQLDKLYMKHVYKWSVSCLHEGCPSDIVNKHPRILLSGQMNKFQVNPKMEPSLFPTK